MKLYSLQQWTYTFLSDTNFVKFVFTVQGLLTYTTVYYCSGADAGNSLKEGGIFWSLLMIVSFLLQAADTVLKVIIVFQSSLHFLSFQTISLWLH